MAWLSLTMPNQTVKNGLKANDQIAAKDFFLEKLIKCSMFLLAPFILQNFKKILRADRSRVMRMCHFWAQNGSFVMNKFFWVQTVITFIFLLALFIVQNLKKILTADPELWACTFFGPKMIDLPPPPNPHKQKKDKLLISLSSTYYPLSLCKI